MYLKKIKHYFNTVKRILFDANYRNIVLLNNGFYNKLSDEEFLQRMFALRMGYKLNLQSPVTFSEKIQWLKLYNRCPEYTMMVDKYLVRDYIKNTIGEQYLIPLLGAWDSPEDIDFDKLPNQFVLKCNHNSGKGMYICKTKNKIDEVKVRRNLYAGLNENYFWKNREWPYKDVRKKIIAEKYMEMGDGTHGLVDYKIYNFHGIPEMILVCQNRFSTTGLTEDFFDCEWNHLNIRRKEHGNAINTPPKPDKLNQMLKIATILSKDIPFVRTDFYVVEGKIYFGEMTFFPASGFEKYIPEEWDYKLGELLKLSWL